MRLPPWQPHCFPDLTREFPPGDRLSPPRSPTPGLPFPSRRRGPGSPRQPRGSRAPRAACRSRAPLSLSLSGRRSRRRRRREGERLGPGPPGTAGPSRVRPAGRGLRGWRRARSGVLPAPRGGRRARTGEGEGEGGPRGCDAGGGSSGTGPRPRGGLLGRRPAGPRWGPRPPGRQGRRAGGAPAPRAPGSAASPRAGASRCSVSRRRLPAARPPGSKLGQMEGWVGGGVRRTGAPCGWLPEKRAWLRVTAGPGDGRVGVGVCRRSPPSALVASSPLPSLHAPLAGLWNSLSFLLGGVS